MPRRDDDFDDDEFDHSHRSHHTKCGNGHSKAAVAIIAGIVAAIIIGLGYAGLKYDISFDKVLNPAQTVVVSEDVGDDDDGGGGNSNDQKQSQSVEIKIIDGKAKIKHKSH